MFVKRKNQDAKIILLFLLINVKVYCVYFWFNDWKFGGKTDACIFQDQNNITMNSNITYGTPRIYSNYMQTYK